MKETIVVTRHPALLELIRERGIVDGDVRVIDHASEEDVRGRDVVGVLPLRLASLANSVTTPLPAPYGGR